MKLLDKFLWGSMTAAISSIVAVLMSSYLWGSPPAKAIVFHAMSLAQNEVRADGELLVTFTYDKRKECGGDVFDPKNPGAEVAEGDYMFKIIFPDGAATSARRSPDSHSADADPVGVNQTSQLIVRLSHIFPPLAPGRYGLQIVGVFKCRGENIQRNPSETISFTVTG